MIDQQIDINSHLYRKIFIEEVTRFIVMLRDVAQQ